MRRAPMANGSQIQRLLAGKNQLGRIEKEQVLDQVLAQASPRRTRLRWLALGVPALAAAVLAIWLVPRGQRHDEFSARGGSAHVASFAPSCAEPCTQGSRLLFDVNGTTGYRFVSTFAQAPSGAILWYTSGRALDPTNGDVEKGVLRDAVVVGGDHAPGRYRVFAVFSDRELSRDEIKQLFDEQGHARAAPGVEVVERELEIR